MGRLPVSPTACFVHEARQQPLQFAWIERLGEMPIETRGKCALFVFDLSPTGHRYNQSVFPPRLPSQVSAPEHPVVTA